VVKCQALRKCLALPTTTATYDYIGPWRALRRMNGNGTYVSYSYDGARRLIGLDYRLTANQLPVSSFQYTYDRVGNRLTETTQPGNHLTTYTYDSLYRLIVVQSPLSNTQYLYDPAGNRTQETRNGQTIPYTVDAMNRYTAIGGRALAYDANGNLRLDAENLYQYDAFNRLVRTADVVWSPYYLPLMAGGGSGRVASQSVSVQTSSGPPTITRHTYDALNRRVSQQVENATERYLYAGGRVIEERDDDDALVASYVGGLFMERDGERSFYQHDARGSVRALADAHGAVVERVDYEAFGKPIFDGGAQSSALGNPNLWRGLRYDADDGLYILRGDRYDPDSGRLIQVHSR